MSNGVAPSRSATACTWSAGTYRNSASGSTNRLISHGHATRSTFGRSRVTHFISSLPSPSRGTAVPGTALLLRPPRPHSELPRGRPPSHGRSTDAVQFLAGTGPVSQGRHWRDARKNRGSVKRNLHP